MLSIKKLTLIASYFCYLIPLVLLTGPFLPDLFLSICSLIFLLIIFLSKDYKYFNNLFFKVFVIFCIYLIINSLTSNYPFHSIKSSLFYFRFGIFSLAVFYFIENVYKFRETFFKFILIAFILAICSGVFQYFFSTNILGQIIFNTNRLALPFSDELVLGQYLSRVFPVLMSLFIFSMNKNYKNYPLLFLLLISTDIIIFLSGERTALGLLFITSFLILVLLKNLRIFRLVSLIFSIGVIIIISIYNPIIKERNIDKTISQLGLNDSVKSINLFSEIHENHIKVAWKMFLEKPLVGHGANNFRSYCYDKKYNINAKHCSTHPHHSYIQLLAETGIIGLSFFLSLLILFIQMTFKHLLSLLRNSRSYLSDYDVCILVAIAPTIWPLLPTLNFFNNWINVIYYLPIGFILHILYSQNKKNNY